MGSSKIWRKGRWYWFCGFYTCSSKSTKTYSTSGQAFDAGERHEQRARHEDWIEVAQVPRAAVRSLGGRRSKTL